MCKTPVTFGGGITMVYGSRSSGSEWKYPFSIQYPYHLSSVWVGSYFAAISLIRSFLKAAKLWIAFALGIEMTSFFATSKKDTVDSPTLPALLHGNVTIKIDFELMFKPLTFH